MADYAPNFTARYKLRYSFEGDTHVCTTRWPSGATKAANEDAAITFWAGFLGLTEDLRHTSFDVLDAEYAEADSNVFLPATPPLEVSPGLRAAASGSSSRIMHSIWQGRSIAGARMRFQMFGLLWATADSAEGVDFYILPTENGAVEDVAGLILSAGMVGPDNESLGQVRARVAYKQNDAWVSNRRQGG